MVDETPAIEAVLKADVKRLKLLEEEERLIVASEAGNEELTDRLREVCAWEGIGPSSACLSLLSGP